MANSISEFDQYLTFAIANVPLMLAAESVVKVSSASPAICRSLEEAGMVPAGQHTVRWLDLHKRMPKCEAVSAHQYLIVVNVAQAGLWGILADSLPDMNSVDRQELQELPPHSSDGAMSTLASHVMFGSSNNAYLLDIRKILVPS
ncbi:MAG: chemotaxis protein CheW [Cyanobacteria bacterium P01_A01_bin.3]